jgi:hypothetical protein
MLLGVNCSDAPLQVESLVLVMADLGRTERQLGKLSNTGDDEQARMLTTFSKSQWVRDLTIDGLESNPGPPKGENKGQVRAVASTAKRLAFYLTLLFLLQE